MHSPEYIIIVHLWQPLEYTRTKLIHYKFTYFPLNKFLSPESQLIRCSESSTGYLRKCYRCRKYYKSDLTRCQNDECRIVHIGLDSSGEFVL